ncbi:hypothetical protein Tco_0111114 [Tanacetum coccineum]
MMEKNKLDEDLHGTPVDATLYRGMIRSLIYRTSSRTTYLLLNSALCARYQAKPTEKHLNVVKRIFRYLKGTINMGLIMNPQEKQQVAARDDKCVPFSKRVNISFINIKLETTVPQKEETFQVVQGIDSYEFLLANKKCIVNAEVFRTIIDICPRVEGVYFTDVPDDDIALTFLIDLGYKGPLYKHTNMFVDHMHQPWRTLAAIINKCLSRKTTRIDKLRKSRIDILWGMFKRENVDLSCVTMLTDAIKQSESYQMFIKYSTGQIPPKKSRGKGSKGKKIVDDSQTSAKKKSGGRSSKSVVIQDTPSSLKSNPATSKTKLKGALSLTLEEQEATNITQALKESGEEGTDATKADAQKTSELLVKDTTDTEINSLLEVKIHSEVLHTQSLSFLSVPISVISKPTVPTPVQESPSTTTATTLPPSSVSTTPFVSQQTTTSIPTPPTTTDAQIITTAISEFDALSSVQLRVAKLEERMDVFQKELKFHTEDLIQKYSLQQIPELPKKPTPIVDLEQGSKNSASKILKIKREQAEKQQTPQFTIKSTDKATLEEYDLKSALY